MKEKLYSGQELAFAIGISTSYFYKLKKTKLFIDQNLDKRFYCSDDIHQIINIISNNSNLIKRENGKQ
ncbi:MAG: hypothetical protein H6Q15_1724 [Bacteroidetes bacterium]|nr:hypothetical protein [Bacteroidota bacterium]